MRGTTSLPAPTRLTRCRRLKPCGRFDPACFPEHWLNGARSRFALDACSVSFPAFCRWRSGRIVERPAAVFLVTPRPLPTGVVQQPLADILPDGTLAVETYGINLLYFDGPPAAPADHPQEMLGNFGQPPRGDGGFGRHGVGACVLQERLPVFGRQVVIWSQGRRRRGLPAESSSHPFHLFCSWHAPTGGAVGHGGIRT